MIKTSIKMKSQILRTYADLSSNELRKDTSVSAKNWNYDEFSVAYQNELKYLKRVEELLKKILRDVMRGLDDPKLVRAQLVESRIKEPASLARKAKQRGWRSDQALWCADDLIGARVVCNNIEDVYRFQELFEEMLHTEVTAQDYILEPGDAGYRALHLNFRLSFPDNKPGFLLGIYEKEVGCEVQILSLLQYAWASLSHDDIYKGDNLPADLRERMTDLSNILSSADQIASRVRKRVSQVHIPDDKESLESHLSRFYSDVFGKSPPDYVIREASEVACQLNEDQWEKLSALLREPSFKQRVNEICQKAYGLRANISERFITGLWAIAHNEDTALRYLQNIVDKNVRELDLFRGQDTLSDMPDSLADFIEQIENDPWGIIPFAEGFSATVYCGACGEVLVDPDILEQNLAEYYELEETPGVSTAIMNSELLIPDFGLSTPLCVSCRSVSEGLKASPKKLRVDDLINIFRFPMILDYKLCFGNKSQHN